MHGDLSFVNPRAPFSQISVPHDTGKNGKVVPGYHEMNECCWGGLRNVAAWSTGCSARNRWMCLAAVRNMPFISVSGIKVSVNAYTAVFWISHITIKAGAFRARLC